MFSLLIIISKPYHIKRKTDFQIDTKFVYRLLGGGGGGERLRIGLPRILRGEALTRYNIE